MKPVTSLGVKGNIITNQKKFVKLIPPIWNLGAIKPGMDIKRVINILNEGYKDVKITDLSLHKNSKVN